MLSFVYLESVKLVLCFFESTLHRSSGAFLRALCIVPMIGTMQSGETMQSALKRTGSGDVLNLRWRWMRKWFVSVGGRLSEGFCKNLSGRHGVFL